MDKTQSFFYAASQVVKYLIFAIAAVVFFSAISSCETVFASSLAALFIVLCGFAGEYLVFGVYKLAANPDLW